MLLEVDIVFCNGGMKLGDNIMVDCIIAQGACSGLAVVDEVQGFVFEVSIDGIGLL